jgi:hypothetical protein
MGLCECLELVNLALTGCGSVSADDDVNTIALIRCKRWLVYTGGVFTDPLRGR